MVDDESRLYEIKILEPGTWPNNGADSIPLSVHNSALVEAWLKGDDHHCGLVIEGGTAPERESLGVEVIRRLKSLVTPPVNSAYVWSEFDFADNYRMLRSLEDFAKRDRDPETWNLYVNYERKFYKLLGREILFFQGLNENQSVFAHHREFLYNEIIRRLTQTQYDAPRYTVISTPSFSDYYEIHRSFFDFTCSYATIITLEAL